MKALAKLSVWVVVVVAAIVFGVKALAWAIGPWWGLGLAAAGIWALWPWVRLWRTRMWLANNGILPPDDGAA